MWRPRDRERFIGSYDPEHEMPDPDRGPGDRWQSDAYRGGARDSRYAYRWNPDRFEERARERADYDRDSYDRGREYGFRGDYGRGDYGRNDYGRGGYGYGYGYDYDRDRDRDRDYSRGFNADRDWGRDNYYYGPRDYDRGYGYDRDRGWDAPRRGYGGYDEYDRDRWRRR